MAKFEKEGKLELIPMLDPGKGHHPSPDGVTSPFRDTGMSFQVRTSLRWFGREKAANITVFLHELVHAIGNVVGSGVVNNITGDEQVAQAVYNMGLMKYSPEEHYKNEGLKPGDYRKTAASNYWGGALGYACGTHVRKTTYMK